MEEVPTANNKHNILKSICICHVLPVRKALSPQTQPVTVIILSPSPDTVMATLLLSLDVNEAFTPAALASDGALTKFASG